MNYKFKTNTEQFLADTISPIEAYFNIRDLYPNSIMLESSDYNASANSKSIICCDAIADFKIENQILTTRILDDSKEIKYTDTKIHEELDTFISLLSPEKSHPQNGIYGYTSYNAIPYFETIKQKTTLAPEQKIPEIRYHFYRFIFIYNHFNSSLTLIENQPYNEKSKLSTFKKHVLAKNFQTFSFTTQGETTSSLTDEQYKKLVEKAIHHTKVGDVFQLVLSRQFQQKYRGDEFTLYRALRNINPSPYLFYFDYGNYTLLGSSPEAQLVIDKGIAEIHPIAGTVKKTGNEKRDQEHILQLKEDPKENAEHTMLVDLARNDLSMNSTEVTVENYKNIQHFSHVIHMVSKVTGKLKSNAIKMLTDSFPAGTLSGAPKYKAMELIDLYEPITRGVYAGAIGFINFENELTHAIIIRSFFAKDNVLYYQAGAGIVESSVPENELNEVYHKVRALSKSIELAQLLSNKK